MTGMTRIAILTGAGISAESGLRTFRDADGLWEGHAVEDVATPEAFEYQPDVGPDPDLDQMRLRFARLLDAVDTYTYNFDPYDPDISEGLLSDDLTSIATDLANGLRHYRAGDVTEALWWWQFSYVATWGNMASAALRALQSIISHDRLDTEYDEETEFEQLAVREALDEALDGGR